jgi:asparagine synthase (glutamine-hydrolysing)
MSGICGIVHADPTRLLSRSDLTVMVRRLALSGGGDGSTAVAGPAGLGADAFPGRLTGVLQAPCHEHQVMVAFHGNLYPPSFDSSKAAVDPCPTLLDLYARHGAAFPGQLRGDFVLAVWDGESDTLLLATDRFRAHPLYYQVDRDRLIFASHIRSLLACPFPAERTIDPTAVVDLVASSIIPSPRTIFSEVRKVPPGHMLTYRHGAVSLGPYWNVHFADGETVPESDLARELRDHLRDAVAVRLNADRQADQLGTFLSGGVDSSTITALLTQEAQRPVKSFSIGFVEQPFNEIDYARIAARAFGVEHHEYFVTPRDTYEALPRLVDALDEPFANASLVPAYLCAEHARAHGCLSLYAGDAGDELFAGNERYATQRVFDRYQKVPLAARRYLIQPLIALLQRTVGGAWLTKARNYSQRASLPYYKRISSYDFFRVVALAQFVDRDVLEMIGHDYDPYAKVGEYYLQAPARADLDRHLYVDWHLTLSDNDLIKVTSATELAGVAVRYPFLDHPLVEFSTRVPAGVKMRGGRLRSFFKNAYADLLPPQILAKKKHGFGLPIPVWLRTDEQLNTLMQDLVLGPTALGRHYFQKHAVEELVHAHKSDRTSFYGTTLWNLMVLELWLRRHWH